MNFIYQIGIRLYLLAARVAAVFNEKARLFIKGQKEVFPYLEKKINKKRPVIWVHSASLGEFEQGRPLIEQIKKKHPAYQVLLTFFSPSGYKVRKNYGEADSICYLPVDTPQNARKLIELVQPEKVFFIKYEYWYNYIHILHEKNIPLYLVSAIFRPEQLFFKSGFRGKWYRKILKKVDHFFVQNQQSADLLSQLGLHNFTITGDTRFDRVAEIASNSKELPWLKQFKGEKQLIVAGSSWPPDEALLIDFLKQNQETKVIFAPHEVKESNIKRLMAQLPVDAIRYSQANNKDLTGFQVLIIDSIGLLSGAYRYADLAYIGGGFGVGIHNTLEAAIYNIPVLFGPNYHKFQEAVMLEQVGAAFPVNHSEELIAILNKLLTAENLRSEIAQKCSSFMAQNLGATQMVLEKAFNIR